MSPDSFETCRDIEVDPERAAGRAYARGDGPQPVHENEPRPTPGLFRSVICYLTLTRDLALSAAAATAEGSAKAITASALGL